MPTRAVRRAGRLFVAAWLSALPLLCASQDGPLSAGRRAYEASDYPKAAQELRSALAADPQDAESQLLLAKTYSEMQQHDAAVAAAEKAVELQPQNSKFHEFLGHAYGEKASHSGWFTALSFAKKTRREFERAVELDPRNMPARQALVEYDCSAPPIANGGEEKARPNIAKLAELDASEGHYAAGNCRRQKKDFAAADAEFTKALESHPQSADLIYDIGDYAVKHSQAERLLEVADAGQHAAPSDPRGDFYRGVALVLKKGDAAETEKLFRDYLQRAPVRSNYPRPADVHEWLGRLFEQVNKPKQAIEEYEATLRLEPKNKNAREALKRLQKG